MSRPFFEIMLIVSGQFQYMSSEMSTGDHRFDSDDEDEDGDGGGWLTQSTFALGNPPVSSRHLQGSERRPLGASGFDVSGSFFLCVAN